jgi:hypothetical protein
VHVETVAANNSAVRAYAIVSTMSELSADLKHYLQSSKHNSILHDLQLRASFKEPVWWEVTHTYTSTYLARSAASALKQQLVIEP